MTNKIYGISFKENGKIGSGTTGKVYQIENTDGAYVVKVPTDKYGKDQKLTELQKIKNGDRMQEFFYQNGVNVPKSEGLEKVLNESTGEVETGQLMENIPGITTDRLEKRARKGKSVELYEKVIMLKKKELVKIKNLGAKFIDSNPKNAIYNPKTEKVYLFDFDDVSLTR